MNIETVEDDIITKLGDISNVKIQSWPENPEQFNHLHPNGSILVRYNGSSYENPPEPNNQKFLTQTRTYQWIITAIQRSLKLKDGHQGVYALIESIRSTLSGYTITSMSDASVMWPIGDRFVSERGGIWIYEMVFAFTSPEHE
jgi:hypothetical protein